MQLLRERRQAIRRSLLRTMREPFGLAHQRGKTVPYRSFTRSKVESHAFFDSPRPSRTDVAERTTCSHKADCSSRRPAHDRVIALKEKTMDHQRPADDQLGKLISCRRFARASAASQQLCHDLI